MADDTMDMGRNILGLVAFATTLMWALVTYFAIDISAAFDPVYLVYAGAGGILVWGVLEMFTKGKYDGFMNVIAFGVCIISGIAIGLAYYAVTIPDLMIYAISGGALIWMIVEWFR